MPIIRIPGNNRKWDGLYDNQYYGSVWKTFNVGLEDDGKVQLSIKGRKVTDSSTIASLDNIVAFQRRRSDVDTDDIWWALGLGGSLYKSTTPSPVSTWRLDTFASSPTDGKDMVMHENDSNSDTVGTDSNSEGILFVTRDTDIATFNDTGADAWNANWWVTTKTQTGLKPGVPHPIDVYERLALVGDGNKLHTIDKNKVCTYKRLTLDRWLQVEHIFHTAAGFWILCSNTQQGNGAIIYWNGTSVKIGASYDAHSTYALTGIDYNGTPIAINDRGQVLEFSGNGFSPMIRGGKVIAFPFHLTTENTFRVGNQVAIRPRGITLDKGLIYINTGSIESSGAIVENRYGAGIWCLDPLKGILYNRYSIGQVGSLDYGQQEVERPGAIQSLNVNVANYTAKFLIGGAIYDTYNSAVLRGIWTLLYPTDVGSGSYARGYFITPYIPASEAINSWETVWIKYKKLVDSTDRIIVKAKGINSLQTVAGLSLDKTITWASTTTFTVTLAATDDALAVGDEVEVLAGDNAGALAHITVISGAHAALQTITIDETLYSSTSAALARFDRWKKLGTVSDTTSYIKNFNIGINSHFIQFKVELRGNPNELQVEELTINYEVDTPNKK